MSTVRESIEVAVPARIAFEQLTHFENYPHFMSGVMNLTPLNDTSAHMVLDLGGNRAEFDARIIESRPGEFLCWEATDGPQVSEALRLEAVTDTMTRVIAELQVDALALMPSEDHAEEVLNRTLKADLTGFKRFCEEHAAGLGDTVRIAANPATVARGIASARGVSHAFNERPAKGVPSTGNLGPLQNTGNRPTHGRPDATSTDTPNNLGKAMRAMPDRSTQGQRQDGVLRRGAYRTDQG